MYGYDRNWERLCVTLEGFHVRYGTWPKRVRLFDACLDELRHLLRPADFASLTNKVALWSDNAGFIAEDDEGHVFDYDQEIDNGSVTGEQAQAWLGVTLISGEDLFSWEESVGPGRAPEPFTLATGQWYAMEMWGVYSPDDPHDSPVRIRVAQPSREANGRIDVAFFHANCPGGGRHREYTLRVLHRGRRWLVALRVNAPEEAVMVFFPLTARWVSERVPDILRKKTREPLAVQLDRMYRFDPVTGGQTRAQ
ncbi:MAG: hypothetical protein EXS18_00350 [Verrucomicrobiae bacterium]|nr:hypothetical protein [Verrucomicrobiae bacterium]